MKHIPNKLPWWKSRVIMGVIVSAVLKLVFAVLTAVGHPIEYDNENMAPVIDAIILLVSFIGDLVAGRARLVQEHAPSISYRKEDK